MSEPNYYEPYEGALHPPRPLRELIQENRDGMIEAMKNVLFKSPDIYERKNAAFVLGQIGAERAIPYLDQALNQERVDGVREAAGAALATLRSVSSDKGFSDAERARVMYALYKNRPIHIPTYPGEAAPAQVTQVPGTKASATSAPAKAQPRCFIATAACGDPFAPEVIALSVFRDDVLLQNRIGKAFGHLYYSVSPPIASVVARCTLIRRLALTLIIRPVVALVGAMQKESPSHNRRHCETFRKR